MSNRVLRIRCAKCSKPVDRIRWFQPLFDVVIEAQCHGETEEMTASSLAFFKDRTLVDQIYSQEGVAFTQGKLNG